MSYYTCLDEADCTALLTWWSGLAHDRGACAELRRTETPADVFLTRGFHALFSKMTASRWARQENLPALAAVAGVLASVTTHDADKSFAESCAQGDSQPVVSELRFAALQKSRTLEELYTRMRRIIHQLGEKVNVLSTADDILHWYKEIVAGEEDADTRNHIGVRWGMDYFLHEPEQKKSAKA
ncbi:MAG: type I-E CRISPR-associated protein Cse2/CasB [Treponema sp.]|nr:type I-E CRISPR-associated protein Cse2/CasB [Treponema sp.]